MSTQVQFRRGTTTQNNAFTGANGEISIDTDVKTIRLHDGVTGGGAAIMLNTTTAQTALNKTFSTGSVWNGSAVGLAYGGTGSSLTGVAGAIAYSGSSGLGLSAAGTSGQVLVSGGTGSPVWVNASSLTTGVATTAVTATNIAGGSAGQLIIQADTGLSAFITAGAAGTFLQSAGAGYAPTWAAGQVTFGSTTVALGATSTSLAGLSAIDGTTSATSFFNTPSGSVSLFTGASAITIGGTSTTTTIKNNVTITGNLTIQGSTETVTSANTTYADSLLELHYTNGGTLTSDDGKDIGLRMHYYKGSDKNAALVLGNDSTQMEFYVNGTETGGVFSGTYGYYKAQGVNHADIFLHDSFTATTSGTSAYTVYSFPIATYRSADITVQVKNGTTYSIQKMLVIHDGTTASISANYLTDSQLQTASTGTTFSATISGGNLLVQATVPTGSSVVKGSAQLFTI